MTAQYRTTFDVTFHDSVRQMSVWNTAPDGPSGYRKAREKAEDTMRRKQPGKPFVVRSVQCVG